MTRGKWRDISVEAVGRAIRSVRGYRIILDDDLAAVYGVSTKRLNQQVRRNPARFPVDFMFQLTRDEVATLRFQNATSKRGRGGRRTHPLAFTEHGAIMVSTVLNTPLAVQASVQIARAFVRMRHIIAANADLARKLEELENKFLARDAQIQEIVQALRCLMEPPDRPARRIGYRP